MKKNKPSKTRIVHYEVKGPWKEPPDSLLQKAVEDGVITQFDDGRREFCWFEGPPSKAMRKLRDSVVSLSLNATCNMCGGSRSAGLCPVCD